jgi:hypothetical protein
MTAPNISHQSGHARAFIDHDPMSMTNLLYVMHEEYMVEFKDGSIVMTRSPEGIAPNRDSAVMVWTDMVEDTIVDIFKAIGKALEIYSDEPSQAYKQGFAEGQVAVYKEWNESLRGQ